MLYYLEEVPGDGRIRSLSWLHTQAIIWLQTWFSGKIYLVVPSYLKHYLTNSHANLYSSVQQNMQRIDIDLR